MLDVLENINFFFSTVFILEAILKIFAMRTSYFKNGWNIFDFFIVLGTIAGTISSAVTNVDLGP